MGVHGQLWRRVLRVVAQASVLTAIVVGTVAYAHQGLDVVLVLDGTPTRVQARASDVAGLLADVGVVVGPRDLVVPSADTPLADGQQVVVRFARPLTVTLDGRRRAYWTTELTVDTGLRAVGIRTEGALLSAARSAPLYRDGVELLVSTPKKITVIADGRVREVTTTALTVGQALSESGVLVRDQDRLSALPAAPVVAGQVVALTRIERRRVSVTEAVAPPVVKRSTHTLAKGRKKVVTTGRPGRQVAVYEVVLADGRPAGRSRVSARQVVKPVSTVVEIGSGPEPDISVPGTEELNWTALARCESGGNARAVNPAGYYGLYQFSVSTWRSVGGQGLPSEASASEQLYRAKLLYARGGAGQWGCGRHLFDE